MLEVAVNQTPRKKILTRSDLVKELEQILADLKNRPQFAALRSYSLDAFCVTDNPFFMTTTLASLATNTSDVLRDQNQVERKEIAALVEALHLVSVKSDHSLSLMRESFSAIEQKADSVQQALQAVLAALPKPTERHRVPPADANVAKLRSALGDLRRSAVFDSIKNKTIEGYWDPRASTCSHLAKMTWLQIIETSPSAIFDLPNFGKSRLKHLLASIERAKGKELQATVAENNPSPKKNSDTIQTAQTAIASAINEIRGNFGSDAEKLSEILCKSNSQALVTAFLSQSTIQRRVGQILGVTESRISQLLQEANKTIVESFSKVAPALLHKFETHFSASACSEKFLMNELGLSNLSADGICLLRVVAISLGAKNPVFKGRVLQTHWSKVAQKFESVVSNLITELPLSSEQFAGRIEQELPNCNVTEVLSVIPPSAYFLKSKNYWYKNQEEALYEILKEAREPMSSQDITDIFETGPRQMRYLLQNSKNIVRIGRNNGRKYSVVS